MISEEIKKAISGALNIEINEIHLEHPANLAFGDYSTNVAMKLKQDPKEIVEKIGDIKMVDKIEVAGNGFINFFLSKDFFVNSVKDILKKGDKYGKNKSLKKIKTIIEYTDPNPFKEFHIGHLMSNTIGEAISRIIEWNGADVKRANYQGDIGMHVAMSVWAMQGTLDKSEDLLGKEIAPSFLGKMYAKGAKAYKEDKNIKKQIEDINNQIYNNDNKKILEIYKLGKKVSLEYFEEIYKILGTKFDYYFFESETKNIGKEIVEKFLNDGVFIESKGAIIFEGEKYGLHTRVFRSSNGIPTYEAKELGLAKMKYNKYKYDKSIIITGNEIDDYFKVLLKVMSLDEEKGEKGLKKLSERTKHIGHGMLRLPEGKMSSRTGDVVTFLSLYKEVFKNVKDLTKKEIRKDKLSEEISIATLKYPILKQGIGKNIIFDLEKSISFEGDSGPYLQYTVVRANAVLAKAKKERQKPKLKTNLKEISDLEKLLYRFPEVIIKAGEECSPSYITTYLTELASAFNSYYAINKIIGDDNETGYRLALTKAVSIVMKNGLEVLGIKVPEKM